MILPRWTVYVALFVLAFFAFIGIPHKLKADPHAGAAVTASAGWNTESTGPAPGAYEFPPLVILGIDGMDPDLLQEAMAAYPEDMKNFAWLAKKGGIHSLGTSTPPQSPVAWSNFITGMDPGGHGIFDFIPRDPLTRAPTGCTSWAEHPTHLFNAFGYKFELPGDSGSNRTGKAFWTLLMEEGVPADIWRMPANFPPEPAKGLSFPGMFTPSMDSAYGQCSFFTTNPQRYNEILERYSKVTQVTEFDGRIDFGLQGPPNSNKVGDPVVSVPIQVTIDHENGAALVDSGLEKLILQPGEWSDFVQVEFPMMPMGLGKQYGIVRFYLRSIAPEFELYASPVNFDPEAPAAPVSEPADASKELAAKIGRYYTQGMAEDVNALKYEVLLDDEFMQQVELVYDERRDMLEYALDHWLEDRQGGLLFFYFSTVDLACHMMWRHSDPAHPAHDPEFAKRDSSKWSDRPGSTWKDTVLDLYRKMDPVLGRIRERLGDDLPLIVMSDHGFAPYRRKFDLNRWLWEQGYLVLHEGRAPESEDRPADAGKVYISVPGVVDWSKTRAYGMGFNGLYLNRKGRELDNPDTPEDESGIVSEADAGPLLKEIKRKLEALVDEETGLRPILRCDIATEVYHGPRVMDGPDVLVGYNAGYGNSDGASSGRITNQVLQDNTGGTFNGSHLMAPEVVAGTLMTNGKVRAGEHALQDLTVEILTRYGIEKPAEMAGHPVLE